MEEVASVLPCLVIKGKTIRVPIVQGGMGIGISLYPLAGAVAREGGLGIISSAALDRVVSKRIGKRYDAYHSAYEEIQRAKETGGFVGINVMGALIRDYNDSVRGAIDAGADAIISGAGLPLALPSIHPPGDTALIPIVSSARALEIICKKWEKQHYRPDAVVVEGPLAGGHLGFKFDQLDHESNRLENLFPRIKEMAMKNGDFPVIVAGGIYTYEDIIRFLKMGADGVQMGTRFLATEESSATPAFKEAVVNAREEDIIIAEDSKSPCGMPFRILKQSPMYISAVKAMRKPQCNKGYLLLKNAEGEYTRCQAKENSENYFCICNGLLSSCGYNSHKEEPLYTVGANAYRVDKIVSVETLMDELTGKSLVPSF